jgi:O-antigen ligase/tetratricopeptide (TPR) repeat protein
MRRSRLIYLLLALYFTFIGGGTYYATIFPVRVAHHVIVTALMGLWLIGRIRARYGVPAKSPNAEEMNVYKRKGHQQWQGLPVTPLNPPIYAAVIVWFISALFAVDVRMSLENVWFLITHVLLFFIIVNLIQRGYQRVVMEILFFMAAIVLLLSGIELASWFFGLGITPNTSIGWIETGRIPTLANIPRLSLAFGISTLQAGYIAPLVIVTAGWALTTKQRDYRIALGLISLALFIALAFTSSRGGLLSLIAGTGAFAVMRLLQYPPLTRRIAPRWIAIAGAIIGGLFLIGFVLATLPFARGNSDSGRLDMYRSAILIARDHPLTGAGVGMFGRIFRDYRNPDIAQDKLASAHNLYLNTSAELGLPGIVVGIWLLATFAIAAWRNWQQAPDDTQRRRLEIVLAALAGLAIHSMVDVFSITPIVLLILTLAAYAITTPPQSRIEQPPQGHRLPAIIALLIVIGYGIAFIPIDRANSAYFDSWQAASTDEALTRIHQAQNLDPYLNLYVLHEAHILGQTDRVDEAIAAYEVATRLEPTWEEGWINLALLEERQGNPEIALGYLERAYQINGMSIAAWFNWGRVAETYELAPDEAIIEAYRRTVELQSLIWLPLSEYWTMTPLRQQAVDSWLQDQNIEIEYRVATVHHPLQLAELVPENPQTAAEWWVVGAHALTVDNDPQTAYQAFSEAIALAPSWGDYYVARARAGLDLDAVQAEHDALTGQLFGTRYEYPNVIRAQLTADETIALDLRANALPLRINRPEFAAVLYNRPAVFDILPSGYPPGHGGTTIQPWLDVAFSYLEAGEIDRARTAFTFISSQAPYNSVVEEQLQQLND